MFHEATKWHRMKGGAFISRHRRPTPPAGHDNRNRLQANEESAAGGQMPPLS